MQHLTRDPRGGYRIWSGKRMCYGISASPAFSRKRRYVWKELPVQECHFSDRYIHVHMTHSFSSCDFYHDVINGQGASWCNGFDDCPFLLPLYSFYIHKIIYKFTLKTNIFISYIFQLLLKQKRISIKWIIITNYK